MSNRINCVFTEQNPEHEKECHTHCLGKIQTDVIYKLSNMPEKYRRNILLYPDECDEQQFKYLQKWESDARENVKKGKGMLIYNPTKGTGKTTWATRMMNAYFIEVAYHNMQHCRGLYVNVPQFFNELKESFDNPTVEFNTKKARIKKADLVIWDDIGAERPTDFVRDILYTYIDYRYTEQKSQIFTSNVSFEELSKEDWLGTRITSRMKGSGDYVKLYSTNDFRGTESDTTSGESFNVIDGSYK